MMDPKPRPNLLLYLRTLRQMSPEERLRKCFELGEMTRALFKEGLRQRFPQMSEQEIHLLYLERMNLAYNRRD